MASINEEARIPVYLNDEQAQSALKNLQGEAARWRREMHKAMAEGDMKGMKNAEKEMKKANRQVSQLKKNSFDVNKVLNNMSAASTNDLRRALRAVNKEMNGLNRNSKEYAALEKKANNLRGELSRVNSAVREQRGLFAKTSDFVNRYWSGIAGGVAAFAGVTRVARQADRAFTGFEERVDNLSALTQLQGEELEYLENTAKQTAGATIEGNIRIKQTASEIADAYTVVGSKRPELLKVKEDLASVTQEAMILSNAAKGPLNESVNGLTMALNQFDMEASESRRIINVLGAGAQAGAGDISYLTDAMEKSGTTANLMGVEIEQWAGTVETIAPYFNEASEAGNSLDKVLLRMKENQIGYKDGVFDMNRALDELAQMYASGQSSADIFGTEHAKMGELLVKNREKLNEYTEAVTDSNTAVEQAATNTDNAAAKRAAAAARRNAALIEMGELLEPMFTKAAEASASTVEMISDLIRIIVENKEAFLALAAAITSYTIAVKAANTQSKLHIAFSKTGAAMSRAWATATGVLTGKIKLATVAQRVWNKVQKANPIGLLAGLLIGAGTALVAYTKKVNQQTAAQRAYNDVHESAQKSVAKEKVEVERLLRVARDETKSKEERAEAVQRLNKISPEYLGNLSLETINTEEAREATEKYIESLVRKQMAQKAVEKMADIEMKKLDAQNKSLQEHLTFWDKTRLAIVAATNPLRAASKAQGYAIENRKEELNELDEIYEELMRISQEYSSDESSGSGPEIGARKTVGNIVYEWDGKTWKKIKTLGEDGSGGSGQKPEEVTPLDTDKMQSDFKKSLEEMDAVLESQMDEFSKKWSEYRDIQKEYIPIDSDVHEIALQKLDELYNDQIISYKEYQKAKKAIDDRIAQEEEQQRLERQQTQNELDQLQREKDAQTFNEKLTVEQERFNAEMKMLKDRFALEQQMHADNKDELLKAELQYQKNVQKAEDKHFQNKRQLVDKEIEIQTGRMRIAQEALGAMANAAKEESGIQKALLITKQAAAVAEATMALGVGMANTAKVGFPQNVPLIAGFLAQTAGLVTSIKNAFKGDDDSEEESDPIPGLQSGGYAERDHRDSTPKGVYHANEFVASADAVRNPSVKPVLDIIDIAQKNGKIASLDLPAMVQNTGGRQAGSQNQTNEQPQPVVVQQSIPAEVSDLIRETRDELTRLRKEGVMGVWDYDYHKKSKEKMERLEKDSRT